MKTYSQYKDTEEFLEKTYTGAYEAVTKINRDDKHVYYDSGNK